MSVDLVEAWLDMATQSFEAAGTANRNTHFRTAVSRYYYAAFQIATAILIHGKLTPVAGWEGWHHPSMPGLLGGRLAAIIKDQDTRHKMVNDLRELYKLRLEADYVGGTPITDVDATNAKQMADHLVNALSDWLRQELK